MLCQKAFHASGPHAQHAHAGHIAFNQGIGGLGGAVGHENNILRGNIIFP